MTIKKSTASLSFSPLRKLAATAQALAAITLLWAGCASADAQMQASETADQPNILLILLDDLGYTDIGAYGSEIDTPVIDNIASMGVMVSDASVLPTCALTRSALMTGQDPHRVGLGSQNGVAPPNVSTSTPGYKGSLEGDFEGIASVLKDAGYMTMMAGKWHLGKAENQLPAALGFDQSVVLLEGAASHYNDAIGVSQGTTEAGDGLATYLQNGEPLGELPPDFYSTHFYTE